jgi:spermidine/putrescine-binding protein
MNPQILTSLFKFLGVLAGILSLAACASTEPGCPSPQTRNLDSAIGFVKTSLGTGCEAHFDRYYDDLLTIAGRATRGSSARARRRSTTTASST